MFSVCCYASIICGLRSFVNSFLWLFDFLFLCHKFILIFSFLWVTIIHGKEVIKK
nr:MAG TPA: hypothetical protein [Caudoviricetes sp.]DAW86888.1 MAG TPA: hypothetical protein [Bacteriophage sp.]